MLEGIFKFWQNPDEKAFTIEKHWLVTLIG